jgi:hypothetical protein
MSLCIKSCSSRSGVFKNHPSDSTPYRYCEIYFEPLQLSLGTELSKDELPTATARSTFERSSYP